jgi:hypothetical protein
MDFVGFPFRISKLKNDINYIKYEFSHRFWKVCRWLSIHYSKIRITTFFKLITMSIWIILNNLIWTCRECNFCRYWTTVACIYPWSYLLVWVFYKVNNIDPNKNHIMRCIICHSKMIGPKTFLCAPQGVNYQKANDIITMKKHIKVEHKALYAKYKR